jgi:FtsZ-interacting cell division protein ZipA
MSAGAIIAIVIGVLIVLALVLWLGKRSRDRQHETRRHEAREIRREAEVRTAEADEMSAEAEERAARARREEAQARQEATRAEEHRRDAEERHARAHDIDPDTKGDYEPGTAERTTVRDDEYDAATGERRFTREGEPDRDPEVVREEQQRSTERADR